ncbi:XRE family transcriptional regulator [Streptococcus agalactiae LMG 14747]|uniref:XRE family transcriptional regulator n=1 Tax=Streptococcus agalactiae LMG 14747 TaxID=1154860 RepID=V6YYQ4_STRAG|nr:XRE family transcriptional regulator [Streptococcus agalactiae LMG 14747]
MLRLKELRTKKGISLNKLSKELEKKYGLVVSDSQLSFYENEKRRPRDEKIWDDLANYFQVSVSYLLGYSNNPKQYEDEIVFKNNNTGHIFSFSPKASYEEEKKKIEQKILTALKDEAVVISDKDIQNIFSLIDSTRLDNPNTYQGKQFVQDVLDKNTDLTNMILELKDDGFSLVFEDFETTQKPRQNDGKGKD